MVRRINRDDIDHVHNHGIHLPTATIWLGEDGEEIGRATLVRLSKNLSLLERHNPETITIILNTPGGDVQQALGIYDLLVSSSCTIDIIGRGAVESAGCIIMQAGDKRYLSRHSHLMYHQGTTEYPELATAEAQAAIKYGFKMDRLADDIVFRSISSVRPEFSRHKFNTKLMRGFYLTAQEAIDWGLADAITGR